MLLPDELTLTLGSGAPFASGTSLGTLALNGRKLADDVIDAEFALLTNFVITTGDGVGVNDKAFQVLLPVPGLAALRPPGCAVPRRRSPPLPD